VLLACAVSATPAAAQATSADPGLDAIMKTVPAGYSRLANDQLPLGPMTATQFNDLARATVPERDDAAVYYGATYARPDGAVIVFLAMSTVHQEDSRGWANAAMRGTLTDGETIDVGIEGAKAVEGEEQGLHAAFIAFARNGRGFGVLAFGDTARVEASRFGTVIVASAESTPTRADAIEPVDAGSAAIGALVFLAFLVIVIVGVVRFVRRRSRKRAQQLIAHMTPQPYAWDRMGYPGSFQQPAQSVPTPPPPSLPPPPPWSR
jgi:hypothetical protein